MRYAIAIGEMTIDPTYSLQGALRPCKPKHHATITEREKMAHSSDNPVRAAYNHAQYLDERRKMVQWWADWLDELRLKN